MRKLYFVLSLLLVFCPGVYAQSLVPQNATLYLQGNPSVTLEAHVDIFNATGANIDVVAERVVNNLGVNHLSYFCWGITCYGPGTSLAPAEPIGGGTTNTSFRGYLDPGGSADISNVTYCFYDENNVLDSTCVEFVYDYTATGIGENGSQAGFLSNASPNPAAAFTLISYRLAKPAADVRLVLSNMLGATVKEFRMDGVRNTFLMNISGLRQGLYFYSLVADHQVLYTKKLMVAERN